MKPFWKELNQPSDKATLAWLDEEKTEGKRYPRMACNSGLNTPGL